MPMRPSMLAAFLVLSLISNVFAADERAFRWRDDPQAGTADLFYGDDPVLRYMYRFDASTKEAAVETYKPYHHVFGPGTDQIITKGPGGLYTHHRGLFVGWNKTSFEGQSLDFWHCSRGAHQKHVRFLEQAGDAQRSTMTAEIHWNDRDGNPVIVETRTVTVRPISGVSDSGDAWQIDWKTTLRSERGEIELNGDRQHAGFQFRAAQEVAEQKSARYIRPQGYSQRPEAIEVGDQGNPPQHINLSWLAMTYPLGDEQYTVEYFEDPSLPKPSLYSERPYGRFGAFFKTTLSPDEPLTMHYRLIISRGPAPERDEIDERYTKFTNELSGK